MGIGEFTRTASPERETCSTRSHASGVKTFDTNAHHEQAMSNRHDRVAMTLRRQSVLHMPWHTLGASGQIGQ